jgi:hypothetical protein
MATASTETTRRSAMKRSCAFLLVLALGAFASACGGAAGDYCDEACDCEGCSDREYDECIEDYEYAADLASAYDCDAEFTDLEDCVFDRGRCSNDRWGVDPDDCDGQGRDLGECYDRGSALD